MTLNDLDLTPLRTLRIYPTSHSSNGFYAVLEKTAEPGARLCEKLPVEFDETPYLLANPDVAKAGVGAKQHYLAFGRRERRKLRRNLHIADLLGEMHASGCRLGPCMPTDQEYCREQTNGDKR